jgi:serine protease Do
MFRRSWPRTVTLMVAGSFAAGLLVAGLFHFPRASMAQHAIPAAAPSRLGSANVSTLEGLSEAFAAVADRVKPSVVYIESTQHQKVRTPQLMIPPEFQPFFRGFPQGPQQRENIERSSGSGVIVSADGDILTNAHVVDGADHVTVRLLDHRQFTARVIGEDPTTDIALIRIKADHLEPATLGNSDDAQVGEWVLAVGNPLGENLSFTVTSGIISAKGRTLELPNSNERSIQDFIQTDAAINPGNSGGPLVNVRGEVIGINAAIASETGFYTGYGFAIPVNLARHVMDQLEHGGRVHRAALGIRVRNASQTDAAYVGLKDVRGVVVEDLGDAGSPARKAGLKAGDVIVAVDGQPVDYVAQVQQAIAFRQPGETVTVEVMRKGGAKAELKVRLQEAPSAAEPVADQSSDSVQNDENAATIGALGITVKPGEAGGVHGLVVTSVDPDGPSADHVADASTGGPDVIESIEGHDVSSIADLRAAVKAAGAGTIVELRLYNAPAQTRRVEHVRLGE